MMYCQRKARFYIQVCSCLEVDEVAGFEDSKWQTWEESGTANYLTWNAQLTKR
mgnify:CR=1 FL=1